MSEAITKALQMALDDLTTATSFTSKKARDRQAKTLEALRVALSQPAPSPQPAVPVVSDELIDCLQDVISHNHDFVKACTEMRRLTRDRLGDDDAGYWTHQIDVLARMKTQAAAALAILALRPAVEPMTREQMIAAVRPLCSAEAHAEKLVDLSMDEYRAIEAHHDITAKAEDAHQPTKEAE